MISWWGNLVEERGVGVAAVEVFPVYMLYQNCLHHQKAPGEGKQRKLDSKMLPKLFQISCFSVYQAFFKQVPCKFSSWRKHMLHNFKNIFFLCIFASTELYIPLFLKTEARDYLSSLCISLPFMLSHA